MEIKTIRIDLINPLLLKLGKILFRGILYIKTSPVAAKRER
jgi:hypothetical protein